MTDERKADLYDGLLEHVLMCEQDDDSICYDVLTNIGFTNAEIFNEELLDSYQLIKYMKTDDIEEVPPELIGEFVNQWDGGDNRLNEVQMIAYENGTWVALDNCDNCCWVEQFDSKDIAIGWCKGVYDGEGNLNFDKIESTADIKLNMIVASNKDGELYRVVGLNHSVKSGTIISITPVNESNETELNFDAFCKEFSKTQLDYASLNRN